MSEKILRPGSQPRIEFDYQLPPRPEPEKILRIPEGFEEAFNRMTAREARRRYEDPEDPMFKVYVDELSKRAGGIRQ